MISKFFSELKFKLIILKANIIYTFQVDTAFRTGTFVTMFAGFVFGFFSFLMIDIIFTSTKSFAGYSRDEMLLFSMLATFNFYLNVYTPYSNLRRIISDVNTGNLDVVLSKPLPSLFYLIFRKISIVSFFTEALPAISTYLFVIKWTNLTIEPLNLVCGIIILFLGHISTQFLQFLGMLPAFWYGESSSLLDFMFVFDYRVGRFIPLEGLPAFLRSFFITFIPVCISTGLSTSVILGKTNALTMLLFSLMMAVIFIFLEGKLWKIALRHYTSASS